MNIISKTCRLFATLFLLLLLNGLDGAQDKRKISYALFLDNLGSMRTQFDQVTKIGKAIARQIHETGPVSIFDFKKSNRDNLQRLLAELAIAVP